MLRGKESHLRSRNQEAKALDESSTYRLKFFSDDDKAWYGEEDVEPGANVFNKGE